MYWENLPANRDNFVIGTKHSDIVIARAGEDDIFTLGGDDIIAGGRGIDTIVGGCGADIFQFSLPVLNHRGNWDHIYGWDKDADAVAIGNGGVIGELDNMAYGTRALDDDDFAIYNQLTGTLRVDPDANGPKHARKVAVILDDDGSPAELYGNDMRFPDKWFDL